MNEYCRIANKRGWSKKLEDETKCEYIVKEKLRKIQLIGLDMLLELDEICRKNELTYFLAFGTLLGAVRHSGFIPWDDDLDVAMPRKDYERLKK